MEEKEEKEMDEWEIRDMADTLIRAEEIKNDPEKMKLVSNYIQKKKKAINSIAGLKKKAAELAEMEE